MTSANVLMAIAASKAAKSNGVTKDPQRGAPYRPPVTNSTPPIKAPDKPIALTRPLTPVTQSPLAKAIADKVQEGKQETGELLKNKIFADPAYFEVYKKRCDELAAHFECGLSDLLILAIAALHEKSGLSDKRNPVIETDKSMLEDLGLL